MERLSGDFNRGYTKAIMDVREAFAYVQNDLAAHKKQFSFKLIVRLLELFLGNRENFREDRDGFIRWNVREEDLEFVSPRREHVAPGGGGSS